MSSLELKRAADELRSVWESELKPRLDRGERDTAECKMVIDRVNDRLDQIEAMSQKAAFATPRNTGSLETKDMIEWARTGYRPESSKLVAIDQAGNPLEGKVLNVRDETAGGVLAPLDFVNQVVKGIIQFSPIREIATVQQTSRIGIQFPKRTGNFAAQWVAETGTRSETTGRTYGLDEIPTHELYARVVLSNWLIEDAAVDIESNIRTDMSDQFGVSEGAALVSGNGIGKPEGFLSNSDVTTGSNVVLNGGASFANGDGIIKLGFSLKEQYWPNARFVLNRFSLRDIRLLKDANNNYLWQPAPDGYHGLSTGLAPTIFGFPYTIAVDMPSAASNAFTVAFGDFKRGYWVVDHVNYALLRDPYSAASAGEVILHARRRVGGQVVLPEALNVLKMA